MAEYERHEWLAKRVETAVDPDRPIIDPHHHLWDRAGSTYLAADLHSDTRRSHNVTHTVFVECSAEYDPTVPDELAPVGETRFVQRQAEGLRALGGTQIAAIVGHADMTLGAGVEEVLLAHTDAGQGLFRGVRHGTNRSPHPDIKNGHHNPPDQVMATQSFRAGISKLAELGLSFDAWVYFHQLQEVAELARAIPECTIVLNHLGGPLGIGPHATSRVEMAEIWRSGIAELATCSNVALKVGGLGMEHYFGTPWAQRDTPPPSDEVAVYWHDIVHFAIDSFSPARCMFESNFPVDRQTLPYTVLWNAFQILGSSYTTEEQDDLFVGCATSAYEILG